MIEDSTFVCLIVGTVIFSISPWIVDCVDAICNTSYGCLAGWHNGKGGTKTFDGCSVHATCSKCGTEVMQDSQGNWF